MKWMLAIAFLIISVVSVSASTINISTETCLTNKSGLHDARYTTHKKGFEGTKCWHSTYKFASKKELQKVRTEFKQMMKEFNEWRQDQIVRCYLELPGCSPKVKNLIGEFL